MTTKYTLCAVLMEISAQLQNRNIQLRLPWRRRDRNVEADELSNGEFHRFDAAKRINVDVLNLPFLVLPDMLAAGTQLYTQLKQQRVREREGGPEDERERERKRIRPNKLRYDAPWNDPYPGAPDSSRTGKLPQPPPPIAVEEQPTPSERE